MPANGPLAKCISASASLPAGVPLSLLVNVIVMLHLLWFDVEDCCRPHIRERLQIGGDLVSDDITDTDGPAFRVLGEQGIVGLHGDERQHDDKHRLGRHADTPSRISSARLRRLRYWPFRPRMM